jgi:succinate dehydrogenase/fumarate reductase flavoprotein subunit
MRALGLEDPKGPALRLMASLSYPALYDPDSPTLGLSDNAFSLIETFYDRGAEAIDFFAEVGATTFYSDAEVPDYFARHPENSAPYGRLLKPPERRIGHDGAAQAHLGRMIDFTTAHGGVVRTNHRVMGLLRNEAGEVVGAEVRAGLRTILVRARRAMIFGTGGFLHDPELRQQFLLGPTYGGCAVSSSTGDFVRIGMEAGAQLGNMTHAWWYQVVLDQAVENSQTAAGFFMPFGDAMFQVNRYGRRVINEKAPYNERGPAHFFWNGHEYPNLVMFHIFDDDVLRNPSDFMRVPVPHAGDDVRFLISGDTWEDLAAAIAEHLARFRSRTGGLELAPEFLGNLKATIERFNHFAEQGVDEDFGRGADPIGVFWSGPARDDAKATMHRFRDTGPYHCILAVAGALDTKGGPKTNARAQVLDGRDSPIPGLYGAGNCVASPTAQAYWGAGATIGCAMVFGYIAGREAAKEPEKSLS